jgi:poly(3-hydroxyalkanoate) synthetase
MFVGISQSNKHRTTKQYALINEIFSYYQGQVNVICKCVGGTLQAVAAAGAEHGVKGVGSSKVTCQYSQTRLQELRFINTFSLAPFSKF